MFKKLISLILCLALMCTMSTSALALSRVDKSFWKIDSLYTSALDAGNLHEIIEYAKQEIEILKRYPLEGQILECLAARTERVALSYEALGDYASAGYYFGEYAPYADMLGWSDAVKIANAKKLQYTPSIDLYKQTDNVQIMYGVINEPSMGVYYGLPSDSSYRNNLPQESMILLYQEFGDTYFDWINVVLDDASKKGIAVEYALNVPREGAQLDQIIQDTTFLPQLASVIGRYKNVPIFLRFGAEMNIWGTYAEPSKFVEAFKKVATTLRAASPKVAMVWSPNMVSSWNINMDDYYPGDSYVDWVGVSLYLNKYFLGREWSDAEKFNEVVFFSGDNSDPVLALKEVADKYGSRKPLMLSESGTSHYVRTMNSDQTAWAQNKLRQIYTYIPMVYPQVKLISHFDKVISHETNDYALSTNSVIANEYSVLTKLPVFIQGNNKQSTTSYEKYDGVITAEKNEPLTLFAYAHIYGNDTPKLDYYIDDVWVSSSSQVGYERTLDLSGYSVGEHKLRVANDVYEKEYTLNIVNNIKLYLDGSLIKTDVAPMLISGRTLVPVRVISESLGAEVLWHEDTQQIDISKGDLKIKMGIENPEVVVNGKPETIDVAPVIINGRTMVPIRWISETLALSVEWNEQIPAVYLTHK